MKQDVLYPLLQVKKALPSYLNSSANEKINSAKMKKEQSFYICLDDSINLENLSPLNLGKDDLFICRDVALDDEAAANLALQCRLKTI